MRNFVFIPVWLIKKAEQGGWLRSLAYFVRLKSLHKTNTHYNFSLRSLSKLVGCSPACLSFHLNILDQNGLTSYTAKNITFTGLSKLQAKYGQKNVGVPVNHKFQLDVLRGQIIRFNLAQQQYNIDKSETQNCQPKGRRKQALLPTGKMKNSYTGLSANGIGNLFGLSGATGSRIRERLKNEKILSLKSRFWLLLPAAAFRDYLLMKREGVIPQYSCYINGNILLRAYPEMKYIGAISSLHKLNKTA